MAELEKLMDSLRNWLESEAVTAPSGRASVREDPNYACILVEMASEHGSVTARMSYKTISDWQRMGAAAQALIAAFRAVAGPAGAAAGAGSAAADAAASPG